MGIMPRMWLIWALCCLAGALTTDRGVWLLRADQQPQTLLRQRRNASRPMQFSWPTARPLKLYRQNHFLTISVRRRKILTTAIAVILSVRASGALVSMS